VWNAIAWKCGCSLSTQRLKRDSVLHVPSERHGPTAVQNAKPFPGRCNESKMPQDFCLAMLGQVGRDIFGYFSTDLGVEFLEQCMIDLPARSKEATVDLLPPGKGIQALSQAAHETFAQLQFDIVPLTV